MTFKFFWTLILIFPLSGFLLAQNTELDSLKVLFEKEISDENKLELLSQMVDIAFMRDISEALTYTKRGVALSESSGNEEWQPKFYEMQGRMYANLLQLDSASAYFDRAMLGYTAVDNKRGQATTAFKIAWVHKKKGEIDLAMEADLKALRQMEALGDQKGIAGALGRVSEDLSRQGRQNEALEYAQRAIEVCEKNNIPDELLYAYRYAGDACIAAGKNEQSLAYYNKSLTQAASLNYSRSSVSPTINSRGNALKRLGRYDEALADYEESLALGKEANFPLMVNTATANLGEINLLLENYEEAKTYILKTIELQEESNDLSNLVENYQHASTIYDHLGDYKSALVYERKSRVLRDNTMSAKSDVAISELRTQYETEKKEATIVTQQSQLSKQRIVQGFSLSFAALLGGFLFFFYRSNQARKKTNKLLVAKNAENELLLKEIHHRVKNNLEVVSSLLALQSAQVDDDSIKDAMQESQNRVESIGIVHQKLYQGQNLGAIEMKDYFVNLSESILDSFGAEDRVTIECAMEKLDVDIDTAVPLGLIVNELLTNSLKYAFPDGKKGKVSIQLSQKTPDTLHLEVADNGIGKSEEVHGTGFGSQLISLLTKQLDGSMREEVINGTRILFDFKLTA